MEQLAEDNPRRFLVSFIYNHDEFLTFCISSITMKCVCDCVDDKQLDIWKKVAEESIDGAKNISIISFSEIES